MGITEAKVRFDGESLAQAQALIQELGLDGWLLYDFHGNNPIASGVLGLPGLTRRYFVLIPAQGRPVALTHRIEQQPWEGWIGETRRYLGWQSLQLELKRMLSGLGRVAMEFSPSDAVPYLDRVPAGVLEMVQATGVSVVSSADLASALYSRWSEAGLASHLRAGEVLRETAFAAFDHVGDLLRSGRRVNEWQMREWVVDRLTSRGVSVGVDSIVAVDANAANPHYAPGADSHSEIRPGCVLLIDLWGKESDASVFADQTWMAYIGTSVPDRVQHLWTTIRDARDSAVEFIRSRHATGQALAGFEVDDVCRGLIVDRGLGDFFLHRTGHSIDRELHGSGPNIDNLETRDTRLLIPGIGFSIEPGVYLESDTGLRTEIDVFMTPNGPEITTPEPQHDLYLVPVG
ncbi:MAG: M24 family metallopeptidase [Gemmatimonadota bacterium]|jgi:Xaa-Pro aminopeptidase|nr:M24 family metallopeptidase [Gemmatimonadota bacterium]